MVPNRLPRRLTVADKEEISYNKEFQDGKLAPANISVGDKTKKKVKFGKGIGIEPVKSDRDSVFELEKQKQGILPGMGLFIISGTTGSGKSVMICNLFGKKDMLKGYYQRIFIFCLSPCPILKECLEVKDEDVINDDAPEQLEQIVDKQKEIIESKGFTDAPRILILCDDCAQSRKFLKHKVLQTLAFAATHYKISVILTTQSYVQIPRNIRINAHYLAIFHGCRKSELERFSDEYESAYLTKKEFQHMVRFATKEKYSFLFVNNRVSDKSEQFRKGFTDILKLNKDRVF